MADPGRYIDATTKSPTRLALRRLHTNSNVFTVSSNDIFEDLYVKWWIIARPPWLTRRSEGEPSVVGRRASYMTL